MDFTNRSVPTQHPVADPVAPGLNVKRPGSNYKHSSDGKWGRVGVVAGLFAVVVLVVGLILLVAANNRTTSDSAEYGYVNKSKLQAVFLNTGQVYFGNIGTLNSSYITLSNIYYLQTASTGTAAASTTTSSNSNVTLVKLGCELHKPYDQMVINRSQVTFWENLESSGQVATAVAKYQTENPKHTCVDQSTSAGTTSGSSAQNASGNSSTTPTTTTTTPSTTTKP